MASKRREFSAMFGTPFEELDENLENSKFLGEAASKKPLAIQEQIVTDEKGRRRFHGAFTGGFSAGYFNTVGTKEGWAPSTFKSTRSKRDEQQARRPEDFMDAEDFSEYGIAPRKIRTTQAFREEAEPSTSGEKRRFAGEASADVEAIADRISELIRPVSNSIGVKLMRSMGWRPGKGVGSAQTALSRERTKGAAKAYGCELPPGIAENVDELGAVELEAMAPGFQFAPSDVDFVKFEPKTDLHGLGYKGLDIERHLTSAKSLEKESALKTGTQQKKGIRGQAFGVGAFEDDDEDLFGTEDLSNYDYALGGSGAKEKQATSSGDFVPASKPQAPRQFFLAPKLPRDYAPSIPSVSREQPRTEATGGRGSIPSGHDQSRNAVHRANTLDESHSVWSLVSERDRQRIEAIKAGKLVDQPAGLGKAVKIEEPKHKDHGRVEPKERTRSEEIHIPFHNDPKKRARFQDFVNYLKRGLYPAQPPDLTEWDWEMEQIEFRKLLPSDLVAAEDDARSRLKPLAGTKLAAVFSLGFKSKFTKAYTEDFDESARKDQEDEDKVKAVQMKMFGAMTREKHEWHPDKNLCKRFNLPNPYPDSKVVGVPYLRKENKAGFFGLNFETITTTADDVTDLPKPLDTNVAQEPAGTTRKPGPATDRAVKLDDAQQPEIATAWSAKPEEEEEERPPISLFKAVFAETSSSSSESEEEREAQSAKADSEVTSHRREPVSEVVNLEPSDEVKNQKATGSSNRSLAESPTALLKEPVEVELNADHLGVASGRDHVELNLYGPALPPETSEISLPPTSAIRRHKHEKKRHRHCSHRTRSDLKSHKHRKLKKEKKKKKSRHRSDSSDNISESGSDSDCSR